MVRGVLVRDDQDAGVVVRNVAEGTPVVGARDTELDLILTDTAVCHGGPNVGLAVVLGELDQGAVPVVDELPADLHTPEGAESAGGLAVGVGRLDGVQNLGVGEQLAELGGHASDSFLAARALRALALRRSRFSSSLRCV